MIKVVWTILPIIGPRQGQTIGFGVDLSEQLPVALVAVVELPSEDLSTEDAKEEEEGGDDDQSRPDGCQ